MKPLMRYLFSVFCLTLMLMSGCDNDKKGTAGSSSKNISVYDRVLSAGLIRCGYVNYPPGFVKDPNTGKPSGIFVDVMEKVARNLKLRLEWSEEVGWGSMIEGLQTNRYDMICSPVWANSTRARLADFGPPLYFSGIGVYVRKGDRRFVSDLAKINNSSVKIATIDGEMSSIIASTDYGQAQTISLPQLSDDSQLLLNVSSGRADVAFVEPWVANQYLVNHPGSIENLVPSRPIRYFPNTVMMRKNEDAFRSMIEVALQEELNTGVLQQLFEKYKVPQGSFLPPALPYRLDVR